MLKELFGSKNIETILIFLFVNSKCYATEIHRLLNTPLTPVQKALQKLEKSGIILCYKEGKTRIYQFNPGFPLLAELEQLLKKAYTLLPNHEKKNYYVCRDLQSPLHSRLDNKIQVLLEFWDKLSAVKKLTFSAKSKSKEEIGWNGKGKGEVTISKQDGILVFQEKGIWKGKQAGEMGFSNTFRWTLDRSAGMISLEHLRRGADHPVFLFHLAPSGKYSLSSVDSHLCEGDTYFGQIHFDRYSLKLNWRVIGPKKNEEINYNYTI